MSVASDEEREISEKFAAAVDKLLTDEKVRQEFDKDPVASLQKLGVDFQDEMRAKVAAEHLKASLKGPLDSNVALAWTSPLVRVATKGTRPVVSVAVNVATQGAETAPK
jgi:hypothetical protein